MKTIRHFFSSYKSLFLAICIFVLGASSQAQPDLSFTNYTLVSGTDRQPGALYRFTNVKPGIDAMVKFTSSVNGATLDSVDQLSSGFLAGFQPLVGVPANTNGYITFQINFVTAGTTTNVSLPKVTHTAIDIDGHQLPGDSLYEWESVNMGNNSLVDYITLNPAITVTQQGNWIAGKNLEGIEYGGIDTAAKKVMFSVINTNIFQYQVRFGVDNRSGSVASRQRSSYFKQFTYPSGVLPVKLASFTATLNNNNKVDIRWTTVSEINVSHFAIEKSLDGIKFSDAGIMFAYGSATDRTNYSYSDDLSNTNAQVVYYRIRSVDIDGKTQYSEIRSIRISKQKETDIKILTYPNPAVNELRVTIPANWQNKAVIYELFTVNGQLIKRSLSAASSQTETISLGGMSSGIYLIKVTCEDNFAQQRVVKQ